jgi:ribosomal protein S18 acetylase RimI-like enzyme
VVDDYEVSWLDDAEQLGQAAGVTARSMRDSPNSLAVSDDPFVRLEMLYATFGEMLSDARVAGVRRGQCVLGAAAAVASGHCIDSMIPEDVRTPDEPAPAATDAERFLVGIEPGFQGMGLGRAAMRLLCDEFDDHHRLAWLETDKPENVRFYIGLGFEVVEEVPMLTSRFWFMRREAQ